MDDELDSAALSLLERIPPAWSACDRDALTDAEGRALFALVGGGLVERRFRIRITLVGNPHTIEATLSATGEYGLVEAVEAVADRARVEWEKEIAASNGTLPKLHCESVGTEEWRLTADASQFKADVKAGGSNRVAALDWLFQRILKRQSVRGRGKTVSFHSPSPKVEQGVRVTNWEEGAEIIAKAIQPYAAQSALSAKASTPASAPRETRLKTDGAVIQAELLRHHGYQVGGSVSNHEPIGVRKLAEIFAKKSEAAPPNKPFKAPSASKITRWFQQKFGSHAAYEADCAKDAIGYKLALLEGEITPAFMKSFKESRDRD